MCGVAVLTTKLKLGAGLITEHLLKLIMLTPRFIVVIIKPNPPKISAFPMESLGQQI